MLPKMQTTGSTLLRVAPRPSGGWDVREPGTETHTVPGPKDRPWWYVPPRPLLWVVGVAFLLQGVFVDLDPDVGALRSWLGRATTLMGALYLVLLACSRRADRRLLKTERRVAGNADGSTRPAEAGDDA